MLTLASDSGGPKMDIITNPGKTGFVALDLNSYTDRLREILLLSETDSLSIKLNGREFVKSRFSEEKFASGFVDNIEKVL